MLASHNSWSCGRPKHLWMHIFQPFSKCQDKSLAQQVLSGVKLFDLRVKMKNSITPAICHGIVEYDFSPSDIHMFLQQMNEQKGFDVRILLDTRNPSKQEIVWFKEYCRYLRLRFKDIRWCGGHGAHSPNWKEKYYQFNFYPQITEKHASVCETGWRRLLLKRYAKKNNEKNIAEYDGKGIIMMDFI